MALDGHHLLAAVLDRRSSGCRLWFGVSFALEQGADLILAQECEACYLPKHVWCAEMEGQQGGNDLVVYDGMLYDDMIV
jgi:hypothetical protein